MRWVPNGPDIPVEVMQALEDGDLVLFCGAGISMQAGLPSFEGLVKGIYSALTVEHLDDVDELIRIEQWDRALYALENRFGPDSLRKHVPRLLELSPNADVATHQALITLATDATGAPRLVTTNFDLAFETARPSVATDAAPKLPIPKKERWKTLVHLHGKLDMSDPNCRNFVLTSSDFGLAYLTEGWASRFVTELFRRFLILFVGYSVEDPVMRYMMDAFAADRVIGEGVQKAFALADAHDERDIRRWLAKGVTPIPYRLVDGSHQILHETLRLWARNHRDGLLGRAAVIRDGALRPEDDVAVEQVVWALRTENGYPARAFAGLDPLPPLAWLDILKTHGLFAIPFSGSGTQPLLTTAQVTHPIHPGLAPKT
jgi:hypothetical protein